MEIVRRAAWARWGPLLVVLAVALVELCWRLGSSSLFIDEVQSWRAANTSLGGLFHLVRVRELTPPTYFLLLHGWIRLLGSDSESVMRALSVIAAVGTVASVYWVGTLLAGRRVAFIAALITAVSPLVLEYGQQSRTYAFTMLAATVSIGCVLQALAVPERRALWLYLGAAAGALALWFHYSAAFVIAPLAVFVLLRRELPARERWTFVSAVVLGGLLLLPFLIPQLHQGNQNYAIGTLTWSNVERVIGAPFDRVYNILTGVWSVVAMLVVVAAVVTLLLRRAQGRVGHPRALAAFAGLAPLVLIVITAIRYKELISRYDAVAVPLMALAIAATVEVLPVAGAALVALTLAIAIPTSIVAHQGRHAYPNTRRAVKLVAGTWRRGDVLLAGSGYPGLPFNLEYYATHLLPRGATVAYSGAAMALATAIRSRTVPGIALITEPIGTLAQGSGNFARAGFPVVVARGIEGPVPMQVFVGNRR